MKYKTARCSGEEERTRHAGGRQAFVESADSSGNIRVYSRQDRRIILYVKGRPRRGELRATSVVVAPSPPVFLFRSGCSIERAVSQGEIALYILPAARVPCTGSAVQ